MDKLNKVGSKIDKKDHDTQTKEDPHNWVKFVKPSRTRRTKSKK